MTPTEHAARIKSALGLAWCASKGFADDREVNDAQESLDALLLLVVPAEDDHAVIEAAEQWRAWRWDTQHNEISTLRSPELELGYLVDKRREAREAVKETPREAQP